MTSIKIKSNVFSGSFWKSSSASFPFFAEIIWKPSSSKKKWAISIFTSLSSTNMAVWPLKLIFSGMTSSLFSGCGCGSILKGIVTTKIVPSPSLLFNWIVPCINSAISLTMDKPRPVPLNVVVLSLPSRQNGSKACLWNSSLIPRPLSWQINSYTQLSPSPTWLYFTALEARFTKIRFK